MEDRRDEALLDDDRAGAIAHELRDAHGLVRVARLGPEEQAQVAARPGDGGLVAARVHVGHRRRLRRRSASRGPPSPDRARCSGAPSRAFGIARKTSSASSAAGNTPSSGRASTESSPRSPTKNGVPSGKKPWHLRTFSCPADERALVELHARDAPVVVEQRVHPRLQQRLVVLVRLLQMLRGHEEPLGPDGLARVDHVARSVLPELAPQRTRVERASGSSRRGSAGMDPSPTWPARPPSEPLPRRPWAG